MPSARRLRRSSLSHLQPHVAKVSETADRTRVGQNRTAGQSRPAPLRLSWPKKLLFAIVTTLLVVGVAEAGLWLFGVRPVVATEDPYVGFTGLSPLFEEKEESDGKIVMQTAMNKRKLFNVQRFPREKPTGSYRIFCFGGSTTLGRPYDDLTSFCGFLREFLPRADDGRRWEVINCGGESYASYREAIIVDEACQFKPDLFIVYGSHNEFLERRTYKSVIETPPVIRGLGALASRTHLYAAAHWAVQSTKGAPDDGDRDVLEDEVRTRLDRSVGPADFSRDDELRKQIVEHYKFNLARIVDTARANGAEVLFVSPAANLRDCTPFKSEHSVEVANDAVKLAAYQREHDLAEKSLKASLELAKVVAKLNLEKKAEEKAKGEAANEKDGKEEPGQKIGAEKTGADAMSGQAKEADAKASEASGGKSKDDLIKAGEAAIYTELNTALAAINRAIAIDDRFAAGHYLRGQILDQLALYEEAKVAYQRALDEDVCPLRAVSELPAAMDEVAEERKVRVIDFAKIVGDVSPDGISDKEWFLDHVHPSPGGHQLLAQAIVDRLIDDGIVRKTGEWNEQTIASVRNKVIGRIDQEAHGRALRNLSKVLEWAGKYEESTRLAEQAAQLAPTDVESYFRMAAGAAAQGQFDKAIEFYELCLKADPKAAVTYNAAGGVYEANGQFEQALDYYRKAIGFAAERNEHRIGVQARTLAAGVLAKLNRLAEAEEELRRAIGADPNYAEAHNKLGLVYARQDRFNDALAKVRDALEIERANASFIRNEAAYLASLEQFKEAKARFLAALEIERGHAETYANLGQVHTELGETPEAETAYRRALGFQPRLTMARVKLAQILIERHEYRDADKLLQEYESPLTLEASANLAWRLATTPNDIERDGVLAVAIAERVYYHKAVGDKSATALDVLAAAYAEVGRFDDAVTKANLAVAAAAEAKDEQFLTAVKARLEGYRAKKPYRDPALAKPAAGNERPAK
jgi:tetratricopeptide (TPR) repeat protein